jgi:hypothetical protein
MGSDGANGTDALQIGLNLLEQAVRQRNRREQNEKRSD